MSNLPTPSSHDAATNAANSPTFVETPLPDAVSPDPDTTGPHQKPDQLAPDLNTTGPHQREG